MTENENVTDVTNLEIVEESTKTNNVPENFDWDSIGKKHDNYSKEERTKLEEIYNQFPLTKKQKKKIIEIELKIENENLYINKKIEEWISQAYDLGKKIILISDMYLSAKQIEYIVLKKLKNKKFIHKIYVSSEHKKTKVKSSMYEFIEKEFDINFNQWLHVGDNYRSDYINATQLGINALYYNVDSYVQEIFKLEDTISIFTASTFISS